MQHRSTTEVLTTFSSKLILFLITTRERSYPLFLPPKLHHRTILPSVIPYRGKDSPVNLCITANRRICKFLRNVWFHFIPPFPKVEIPRVDERDPLSQMEEERRIRFVVYIYIYIHHRNRALSKARGARSEMLEGERKKKWIYARLSGFIERRQTRSLINYPFSIILHALRYP